jgi:hypothetical protein
VSDDESCSKVEGTSEVTILIKVSASAQALSSSFLPCIPCQASVIHLIGIFMMLSVRSLKRADYNWEPSKESPSIWQRRPLANEVIWLARPKDSRDLFVYASLSFTAPVLRNKLKSASESAWKQVRFDVPELVLTTGTNLKTGDFYMQYQTPQSEEDVDQWIKRTSVFEFGQQRECFSWLRRSISSWKRNHESENAMLFSLAYINAENSALVHNLQIMIYVDHLITDGIGARILLGRYLSHLAYSISTSVQFKLNWQENHARLSPPWTCCTNPEQEYFGAKYEKDALWNQDVMTSRMVVQ